jgi:flagellar basal body rod protein FlgB
MNSSDYVVNTSDQTNETNDTNSLNQSDSKSSKDGNSVDKDSETTQVKGN